MAANVSDGNHSLSSSLQNDLKQSKSTFLISDEIMQKVTMINFSIVCTVIAVLGIFANIINITVFMKQGFNDTVNMSLFTLAIADLVSLIFLVWVGMCFDPSLKDILHPLDPNQVVYLTGGQPRLYFTRVAGWITSLVAIERCVCVLKPLQVKLIFTKNRLVVILVFIFIAALMTMVPVYYTTRLSWRFDPSNNKTYIGLAFIENHHEIDRVSFALGVTVSISAFIIVTSCTLILGWSLVKQSRWRARTMGNGEQNSANKSSGAEYPADENSEKKGKKADMSTRDRQAVRTVTFIAAMFVICFLPNAVNLLVMSIEPGYNKEAKYQDIFLFMWSFAQIFEAICSSANIIVYFKTSTKFKDTLIAIIKRKTAGNVVKR